MCDYLTLGTSLMVQDMQPTTKEDSAPSSNNYEVSASSKPSAKADQHSSISLACEHRIGNTIGHSPGDAIGCANDGTTCCGIDDSGSVEQSNPVNRTLSASTSETQSEHMDGTAFISQDSLPTLDASNLGNVVTSLSYHHLDGSDEMEDYSNVRIADPPFEHIESPAGIYEDSYSFARPSAEGGEFTEEESENDYSNATLLDDVGYQLAATETQPVLLQSLMDNSNHDESEEDEEGEQDSDNYYADNYSRASDIRRLQ